MELKMGLIADYANITQDGKLNVMGIFSRILAQAFPVTHPVMHLVLVFNAGTAERGREKEVQIRLLDDDGQSVIDINGKFTVPDQPGATVDLQQIFAIQLLQFKKPGHYAFHVLINGDTKAILPLAVEQTPLGARG